MEICSGFVSYGTSGGDVWWGRLVGTYGGDVWWGRLVGTYGGDVWWGRLVGTYGGCANCCTGECANQKPTSYCYLSNGSRLYYVRLQ